MSQPHTRHPINLQVEPTSRKQVGTVFIKRAVYRLNWSQLICCVTESLRLVHRLVRQWPIKQPLALVDLDLLSLVAPGRKVTFEQMKIFWIHFKVFSNAESSPEDFFPTAKVYRKKKNFHFSKCDYVLTTKRSHRNVFTESFSLEQFTKTFHWFIELFVIGTHSLQSSFESSLSNAPIDRHNYLCAKRFVGSKLKKSFS